MERLVFRHLGGHRLGAGRGGGFRAEQQREVMHCGDLPEVSRTLCSTLYPSDERRRPNPTASSQAHRNFWFPQPTALLLCDRLHMRKAVRIVFLFVVGLLSSAFLGVITAMMTAVSLAATAPIALVVPGTGTPDANIVTNY